MLSAKEQWREAYLIVFVKPCLLIGNKKYCREEKYCVIEIAIQK